VVVNSAKTPTAAFIHNPNWTFPGASTERDIRAAAGENVDLVDANHHAVALLGDAIYTNPFVLGYAWQRGWLPLTHASLVRAIELNGVQVDKNLAAFEWGRRAAHDPAGVNQAAASAAAGDGTRGASGATVIALHTKKALDTLIAKRVDYLSAYQNAAYAKRYSTLVEQVRNAEAALDADGNAPSQEPLTEAVARNLHKLMAYKDEYEVARLYADPAFVDKLKAQFEGDWQLKFHLAPPLLAKKDAHGHLVKKQYGPSMLTAFRLLAKLKFLRGGPLDIFGRTEERRTERALIGEYEALVRELISGLTRERLPLAIELANLPDEIRGYGHVKENNLRAVRVKWNELLARWRSPGGGTARVAA
jgi:indolepyruvate ferredoxin oxidoreductase